MKWFAPPSSSAAGGGWLRYHGLILRLLTQIAGGRTILGTQSSSYSDRAGNRVCPLLFLLLPGKLFSRAERISLRVRRYDEAI
jgi:hypothetical protein